MLSNKEKKIKQLNEIFYKTREPMQKITYRFFQDQDISDDIIQEAYIRIYDKLPINFVHESKLLKWCSTICKNLCIDYYRKKIRNKNLINKIVVDFKSAKYDDPSAEDNLSYLMIQEIVEKVLNQLSSTERMIYTMYAYSTFSMREIAEMSQRDMNRIRNTIRKINKKIKLQVTSNKLSDGF